MQLKLRLCNNVWKTGSPMPIIIVQQQPVCYAYLVLFLLVLNKQNLVAFHGPFSSDFDNKNCTLPLGNICLLLQELN